MTSPKLASPDQNRRSPSGGRSGRIAGHVSSPKFAHATVLEEARIAGLLNGEKSEHVSFRAPPALVEAAKREAGVTSTTELGLLALALLAQPDPFKIAMRRVRGSLGPDHQLEY